MLFFEDVIFDTPRSSPSVKALLYISSGSHGAAQAQPMLVDIGITGAVVTIWLGGQGHGLSSYRHQI